MATKNDFILLEQKCIQHYQLALPYLKNQNRLNFTDEDKARFGFYYFIIKMYTELSEYADITQIITDTDFNTKFFNLSHSDEGIDAVYIDEENKHIQLFNFKYRSTFNIDSTPSKDGALKSSKFFNVLLTQKNNLNGRMKGEAQQIIDKLNGKEVWNTSFYIVSNDNKTLEVSDPNIRV